MNVADEMHEKSQRHFAVLLRLTLSPSTFAYSLILSMTLSPLRPSRFASYVFASTGIST